MHGEIADLRGQVIPDPDKVDPDILDFQLSENLNNILSLIRKWLNSVI